MRDDAWWKRFDSVPGWFNEAEGKTLYQLIYDLPTPAMIVEIGCFRGKSTIAMLQACADSSNDKHKMVISIDPFDGGDGSSSGLANEKEREKIVKQFRDNVKSFNLDPWLSRLDITTSGEWFESRAVRGTSEYAAFFIDGFHSIVDQDMKRAWPLIRSGGKLICHDFDPANMKHFMIQKINSAGIKGGHCGVSGTSLWVAHKI